VVGLKGCSEAPEVSSTTRGLPGGKMPTTGSPTTEDIEQAGLFAFSVVLGARLHAAMCMCKSDTYLVTRGTFTPKCKLK
jgi:hypothetical protein